MAEPSFTTASTSATATRIFDQTARHRFGDRELIKIEGIVVVDRAPEEIAQIADRGIRLGSRRHDGVRLCKDGKREVGQ